MKRKATAPRPRNPHARSLATGRFGLRVVKDKTKYTRKIKHRKEK